MRLNRTVVRTILNPLPELPREPGGEHLALTDEYRAGVHPTLHEFPVPLLIEQILQPGPGAGLHLVRPDMGKWGLPVVDQEIAVVLRFPYPRDPEFLLVLMQIGGRSPSSPYFFPVRRSGIG